MLFNRVNNVSKILILCMPGPRGLGTERSKIFGPHYFGNEVHFLSDILFLLSYEREIHHVIL